MFNVYEVDVETISKLKQNALEKRQEFEKYKKEEDEKKEVEFLVKLKESSDLFIQQLMTRAWMELNDCASKGFLRKKFFFENFKEKFGPVKVSTLVKGFHIRGVWDPSIFEKIGLSHTPFQEAVRELKQRGIQIKDVSDISKGTGFWIEVSFLDNVA